MIDEAALLEKAKSIRLLVLDVDGVLADGGIVVDTFGHEVKRFHVRDGFGIRSWMRVGHQVAILSGRHSQTVAYRARELGIDLVWQGHQDKVPAFKELLAHTGLHCDDVCYIGDDLPDLPLILCSGIGATVVDAVPEVRAKADWVSTVTGGNGAVRELIEFLLKAQDRWNEVVEYYSRTVTF